ncbi:MAG: sulfatase-like hydrolase/transferase [Pseudomonadota bacterium]
MTKPRNIVLITFDDAVAFWKYKALFGQALHTPNLDRICAQSTAFHAAYCQSPICSPSRASFMSGRAPHQTGVTEAAALIFDRIPPEAMWPATLKNQGYFTSSGGKIILGYVPLEDHIHRVLYSDKPKSFRKDWRVPPEIRVSLGGHRGGQATVDPAHDTRFYDFQASRSAIRFFNRYQGAAPFYREVGFYGPHGPWITPLRFKEMYDPARFEEPAAWANGFQGSAYSDAFVDATRFQGDRDHWQKSVRNYFSALSHVDHHLGRVWDGLKASGHGDDTVVIIASDHGLHLGERGQFRKYTLWEQVANVPLIIHDPRQPVGQVVSDPVALIDIGPTVMDYAGLPPPEGCPGRSLRPYCDLARDPDRAVPTLRGDNASIRKGRYRFTRYEDGSTELYDLARDWWQTRNLGTDHPAHDAMAAAHQACCADYGFDPRAADAAA